MARLYILVTSYAPMRLLLNKQGLLLRASSEYKPVRPQPQSEIGNKNSESFHTNKNKQKRKIYCPTTGCLRREQRWGRV